MESKRSPSQAAIEAFAAYAAMDAPRLPDDPISALQVRRARDLTDPLVDVQERLLVTQAQLGRLVLSVLAEEGRETVAVELLGVAVALLEVATCFRIDVSAGLRSMSEP